MDVHELVRLKSTIESTVGAVDASKPEQLALGREPLHASYRSLRPRLRNAVDANLHEEFDDLFPEEPPDIIDRSHGRLGLHTAQAIQAKTLLEGMAGWLGGIVATATEKERMRVEADAYARERVRQERGVGLES